MSYPNRYKCVNSRIGDGYDIVNVYYFSQGIKDGVEYVYDDIQDPIVANALCDLLNKVKLLTDKLEAKEGKPSV